MADVRERKTQREKLALERFKRVMLTGAGGYIGQAVLGTLLTETECDVVAVTRKALSPVATPRLTWLQGDLLDPIDCGRLVEAADADCVVHLAWYANHGRFWSAPENLHWVRGTLNLLEHFSQRGGRRIVFAGTCAEYDWTYGYCTENHTPTEPGSLYGHSKDATRRLVAAYCREKGIEYAWGRLFYPYGIGEPPARLVPSVISALLDGRPVQCSHGGQFRDFLDVRDAAAAFAHLAVNTSVTGEFNISSGTPVRIRDFVMACVRLIRPDVAPQFGALPAPDNDPPMLVGDNRRLSSTGWKQQVQLEDGLTRLVTEMAACRTSAVVSD
jgi:nucleoside-diphosphate-sugar epimerase